MSFIVIIPARFSSKRFPGKILADICGKSMIIRVIEQALDSGADKVIVATDHMNVVQAVELAGLASLVETCLTRCDHQSGTERIAEVVERYGLKDDQIIVHLQGDEPLVSPKMIEQVANVVQSSTSTINMVTMARPLYTLSDAYNSNIVKVVITVNNYALYFSRSVIPWININCNNGNNYKKLSDILLCHIGMYSYRVKFLNRYVTWSKSPLEEYENLEQLRVLWHEQLIYVVVVDDGICNISVDTPDALTRVNALLKLKGNLC